MAVLDIVRGSHAVITTTTISDLVLDFDRDLAETRSGISLVTQISSDDTTAGQAGAAIRNHVLPTDTPNRTIHTVPAHRSKGTSRFSTNPNSTMARQQTASEEAQCADPAYPYPGCHYQSTQ